MEEETAKEVAVKEKEKEGGQKNRSLSGKRRKSAFYQTVAWKFADWNGLHLEDARRVKGEGGRVRRTRGKQRRGSSEGLSSGETGKRRNGARPAASEEEAGRSFE